MNPQNLFRCLITLAAAVPLLAHADSLNARPGAWEMTTSTTTSGMMVPPDVLANMSPEQRAKIEKSMKAHEGKARTHVTKTCVTKEDLDQDRMLKSNDDDDGEGKCVKKVVTKTSTKLVMEQTCAAPRGGSATTMIETKTPETVVAVMDMTRGTGGKVHVDIKGRWLAASCAGIKGGG